jgi:phosphoribosylformylglycinamidine cyclo-ligase
MNRTFNNGIGMVVVVDAAEADSAARPRCALRVSRFTRLAALQLKASGAQVVVA